MEQVRYDVIVVGAGPAGVTAAASVARTGASVLLLEAGAFAGAENWSGCVYFTESLLHPEAFGPEAITDAPYERRLVKRGVAMSDGETVIGLSHQNPDTFKNCYTVLRPAFDPYWAARAKALGATVLADTTVTSLIRRKGRVVGVHTNRGPAYADITFLAEGDASHLVRYEGLETVSEPGFTQGVKAVYKLDPKLIEARFGIGPDEGAANEVLVRNAHFGGRTMKLNMAAFVYSNRDTISAGYAVPLANLTENFRGKHEDLLTYVTGLPGMAEYLEGAELSAFGTKLIRTGGIRRAPRWVEDGLVVGGSAAALGIDAPYPNFTGPAAATGLYFGRAVAALAQTGQAPSAHNLSAAYLEPLKTSRYWADAQTLKDWPDFLEGADALFSVDTDITCGAVAQLTAPTSLATRYWRLGRLLREHLSLKKMSALMAGDIAFGRVLGITPHLSRALSIKGLIRLFGNSFTWPERQPESLRISIRVNGEARTLRQLPMGVRGPVRRHLGAVGRAMEAVYRNGDEPFSARMKEAVDGIVDKSRLFDILLLTGVSIGAAGAALASALYDLFRYKILKIPAAQVLDNCVHRDIARLKAARDLEGRPDTGAMAARLATNSYLEGGTSHIRVQWPDSLPEHAEFAQAPYWSICPAGVYAMEPSLGGHGQVSVNFENCVKCESCWQGDPSGVRWGRHTDHQLVYRPDTAALDIAMEAPSDPAPHRPRFSPVPTLPAAARKPKAQATALDQLGELGDATRAALIAFEVAVENLPASADASRGIWPSKVGAAARHRLHTLGATLGHPVISRIPATTGLPDSPFVPLIAVLEEEAGRFSAHLEADDLFEAVAAARRLIETVLNPLGATLGRATPAAGLATVAAPEPGEPSPAEAELRQRFDDQNARAWDRDGIGDADAATLTAWLDGLPTAPAGAPWPEAFFAAIRAAAALHAGLGLLALHRLAARSLGIESGVIVDGNGLNINETEGEIFLSGSRYLVPGRFTERLVVIDAGRHAVIDLGDTSHTPLKAGGMHPAAFYRVDFDNTAAAAPLPDHFAAQFAAGYGALGLGAGDYLARRALEQAEGRIQFPGQMQDVAGHDSIAKFGAVKALVTRTLAWRELLACLTRQSLTNPLASALIPAAARMAFSPKNGRMGYDAGQVFGGTGYSEDEQMSRCYRDSALFVHLCPGDSALNNLADWWRDGDGPLASRLPADGDPFAILAGGPLTAHLAHWQRCAAGIDALAMGCEAATEALALAMGCYHLLTSVSRRLEDGHPVEGEAAALATLLDILADLIAQAQAEQAGNGNRPLAHFPEMPEVDPEPLAISYDELVHIDDPYDSGDFLRKAPGTQPQFIPEIQLHDPALRDTWKHCYQWFLDHCDKSPDLGDAYEHYMERLHTIPPEMLVGFKKENFFASVVPADLDGLGWKKVGYYLLVSGAMRFGDASLSLLIMASTSIGTTPALIGRDKEIPLVAKELGAFKDNPKKLQAIGDALNAVVAQLAAPDPKKLQRDVTALVEQVDATIRHTKVVKYLAQNFLMAFYGAALAGKRRDFAAFSSGLKDAQTRFDGLQQTIEKALTEVPRRQLATDQFLRALGNGAVAAFALTEPTAGSDSGGVATTAHLKSVPLTPMGDGRWRFEIDGQERFLLDANRIDYQDGSMVYRLQCGTLAPISCDGYDYASDRGTRTVDVLGETLPFHDIAQVRDAERYEFYEVSGAKMWITNGRCATQFSMYVKTNEGITGLMVDRHAEGLIVGRDEEKMGQQGSPTNELSIDRMRVPRENVIGYEGHGQVNALDTLNVGRCGLAVAGVVMTRRILVEAKQGLPQSDAGDTTLSEVAARTFANESLVFHLIGRFDNKSTRSVRLESAIAKYTCSELLHDAMDRIEPLWGPRGQTRELLVEKMRRDARILNIYEGTNEVQRFLILRELCAMAPDWAPQHTEGQKGQWAAMGRWKDTLQKTVAEAVATLGDAVWQDAAMQTAFFPLAEMAGELYLLDATLYRTKWLKDHQVLLGDDYSVPMLATGKRAATQCLARLQALYERYNRGRENALNSRYPADAVAADAAMEAHTMVPRPAPALGSATTITCLLRPVAVTAPTPRLTQDGHLREALWRINPADEHGLAQALAIKASATAAVTVNVLSCGGQVGDTLLREALGAGADRAVLLALMVNDTPERWADAIANLPEVQGADLLLSGENHEDADAPLAAFLSGRLGRDLFAANDLKVAENGGGLAVGGTPLKNNPAVLAVSGNNLRIRATLSGMARAMAVNLPPMGAVSTTPTMVYRGAAGDSQTEAVATDVAGAAELIRHMAQKARRMAAPAYDGEWEKHPLRTADGVWAVAQSHETEAATAYRAVVDLSRALGLPAFALAIGDETGIRRLAGVAQNTGIDTCFGIDTEGAALSESGRRGLLASIFESKANGGDPTRVVAPADWTPAIGQVAGSLKKAPAILSGVSGLSGTEEGVIVSRSVYAARLNADSHHGETDSLWLTVAPQAGFKGADPLAEFIFARPGDRRFTLADLDTDFTPPVPSLKGAEVIVDMGLGAGTPAGMALGEQLMEALSALSLNPHMGATRKVTQGLSLLPQDQQIGQTGITVNPKLILCLGISGAPQHTDYIGSRAQLIAFNKDPDAPIMSLDKAGCTVHPIVGDLFETVGELISALKKT